MKRLQKLTWLGGFLVAASGVLASPAYAADIKANVSFSGSVDPTQVLENLKNIKKTPSDEKGLIGLPMTPSIQFSVKETFEVEGGDVDFFVGFKNVTGGVSKNGNLVPSPTMLGISSAYVDYGMFRMGLAPSIFGDAASAPAVLGGGFSASIGKTLPQMRWNVELSEELDAAVATEAPQFENKEQRFMQSAILPDVAGTLKYTIDEEAYVKGAMRLSYRGENLGEEALLKMDMLVAGKWDVMPDTVAVMAQAGLDRFQPTADKILDHLKGAAHATVGASYKFAPEFVSTLAYSVQNKGQEVPSNVALNLGYNINENVSVGGEYMCKNILAEKRENVLGTSVKITL